MPTKTIQAVKHPSRLARAKIFADTLTQQRNVCACCGATHRKHLVLDHNHATGVIRARVCRTCNILIGYVEWARDNAERHAQILAYIQRTEAQAQP